MTKEKIFLADTYALLEIIFGNENYKEYKNCKLITTKLNLMELYYALLREYNRDVADKYLMLYSDFIVPISFTSIRKGMNFKLIHKKEKLSYTDCIGYALATELGLKFLTGDNKFRDKENVEFVE